MGVYEGGRVEQVSPMRSGMQSLCSVLLFGTTSGQTLRFPLVDFIGYKERSRSSVHIIGLT